MSDLERGLIHFFQASVPSLSPGDYTVAVDQTVREVRPEPFRATLGFSVAGPRFSLNPSDVYSVYPPANQSGQFGTTLPHIVLTRRTLPWERTIDGGDQDEKQPCPWLALLVLSPSDFPAPPGMPRVEARKVGALLNPEKGVKGPEVRLERYQSQDDLCNTIDIPIGLFSSIVPARADLPLLAHVRQVSTESKETLSLKTDGCFSVVLANRFPETTMDGDGLTNTAVLVSLEGFGKYLYGDPGVIKEDRVRLAVLASWSFLCQGTTTFQTLVEELKAKTGLLRLPPPSSPAPGGDDGAGEVKKAFHIGYTALAHQLRQGEATVSWYRGPLVPHFHRKLDYYLPLPCADAALRYNYETGLLEVTYAAAWQLGRLLALQNPHFAQAMYRCRTRERQSTKSLLRKSDLDRTFRLSGKAMNAHVLDTIGANTDAFR